MMSIWKFPLRIVPRQVLDVPDGARFLNLEVQDAFPVLYAVVDTDRPRTLAVIHMRTTGDDAGICAVMRYLGTAMLAGGTFVAHFFYGGVAIE